MIYPDNFEYKIGFDRIRNKLLDGCMCEAGRKMVEQMKFQTDFEFLKTEIEITAEMKTILVFEENFPQDNYIDASSVLEKIRVEGTYPTTEELIQIKKSLETIKQLKSYLKRDGFYEKYPLLHQKAGDVETHASILAEIERLVDKFGKIKDNSSPELKEVRNKIKNNQNKVNQKLQRIIKSARQSGFTDDDAEVTFRNGRPVIPVTASAKRQLGGIIHDESATGKTSFVEPAEIVELNNSIKELEYVERREVIKILVEFASNIRPDIPALFLSYEFLGQIDFLRAKARFAISVNGNKPILENQQVLNWRNAVHPLLYLSHKAQKLEVVPLTAELTREKHILVISGPNAGGKSVCLKTVGLLQYMLQCGLLIPLGENSESGIFQHIFIDIGDEQSIDNDLSTYSSHLTNMKFFAKNANDKTLFLIDEFGTGTEPALGGAIAEAILDDLCEKRAFGVVTTHYANLKHYASEKEGVLNGAMMFDTAKIEPLYKLTIGKPGSSFAIDIARKIGLPESILNKAQGITGVDQVNFDKHLREIIRDKKYWETKRQRIRKVEKSLDELYSKYQSELSDFNKNKKTIINEAKSEAKNIIKLANTRVEKTIREIKESQADKERTLKARQKLEEYREDASNGEGSDKVDKKIKELKKAEGRLLKYNPELKKSKKKTESKNTKIELEVGCLVKIEGMNGKGEVIKIDNKKVVVAFGLMQTTVDRKKITEITVGGKKKAKAGVVISGTVTKRKLEFKSEIDVRGKRAEEALVIVQQFIDDAVMVTSREVRILHGKGNGVLRQLIRDYLKTIDVVQKVRDEHADRGGAGITIVELNYS